MTKPATERVFRKSGYRFCDQNTRSNYLEHFLTANRIPLSRKMLSGRLWKSFAGRTLVLDDDRRADLHPVVQVDDVVVDHPEAS